MSDRRKVELFTAYLWTCNDCGRDNFVRSVVLEPGAVDVDELPDSEAIRDWIEAVGTGNFCTIPTAVRCEHCGAEFETRHADEDEEGDDP